MAENKYTQVRRRYSTMRLSTFDKFYNGDWTPTKKYFEYMVKMWYNCDVPSNITINYFISKVKQFDELLPYIEIKDIYDKNYTYYSRLEKAIFDAEEAKIAKSFVKEDHVNVLYENDRFSVLEPTTHTGSLKYGATTKWCTAAREYPGTFHNYIKTGALIYVLDKTGKRDDNYEKLAFYQEYKYGVITSSYNIYNVRDNSCNEDTLNKHGWSFEELLVIDFYFKLQFNKNKSIKKSENYVSTVLSTLKNVDFEKLFVELNNITEHKGKTKKHTEAEETISAFLEKINKIVPQP